MICAASYSADRQSVYAFVFRVPSTTARFTLHAAEPDQYLIGETYTMTITEPDDVLLGLAVEDWQLLRHCLHTIEQHWHDATATADAGAAQPQRHGADQPGRLTVEPTPAGYRAMGQLFRTEAHRARELRQRLDQLLADADAHAEGDRS